MSTAQDLPAIGSLAPWFGAKRLLAPEIVSAIGPHRAYWEPFCGSLAVLLAKPVVVMETANDLHGDLINLARVLKDEVLALDLYGRAARTVFHEDLFHESAERIRVPFEGQSPDVGRAEDFLSVSWFGRNGTIGTKQYNHNFCVRYTSNGGHAATRWGSVVASIPAWHARLRSVTLLNRDAFEVLGRIEDREGVAIYCDPPYLAKGASYVHDFEDVDHERLAGTLGRFNKSRVVVSYYAHPRLEELYPGWRIEHLDVPKAILNAARRGKAPGPSRAPEVLLINDRQPMLF
jgi:DNA adenine methylase